jgi:hypothetical protein
MEISSNTKVLRLSRSASIVFFLILVSAFFLMTLVSTHGFVIGLLFLPILFVLCGNRLVFLIAPIFILIIMLFKNFLYHLSFVTLEDGFSVQYLSLFFGYDYLLTLFFGGFAIFVSRLYRKKQVVIYILLICSYILIGLFNIDIVSVAAYSRFYLTPLLAICLGFLFCKYGNSNYVTYILILLCVYVFIESIPGFYELIQVDKYLELKYYGRDTTSQDYLHKMGMTINGVRVERILGPQMHPISIGYVLLFLYVYSFTSKTQLFYFITPLVWIGLFLSSKGALTAGMLIFGLFFCYDFWRSKRFMIYLLFGAYTLSMIAISLIPSLTSGYEHMLGLIGGLSNLISNPVGAGIGVGGTMSSLKGTENGGESGFGTIITHMGVVGLLLYFYVGKQLFSLLNNTGREVYAFSVYCIVILINGLLQEEALLPSAAFLGWFMLSYYYTKKYRLLKVSER